MKKVLLMAFIAFTVLAGCKKDDSIEVTSEKLQGRWNASKELERIKIGGAAADESTTNYTIGELYVVFSGNTFKLYEDNTLEEEGTFSISGGNLTLDYGGGDIVTGSVTLTSDTQMVVKVSESETFNGVKYEYYLETTFNKAN